MVGKKGIIRVFEAVLAILIVLSVLLFILSNQQKKTSVDLSENIPPLLEEIAQNKTLRQDILDLPENQAEDKVKEFLSNRVSFALDFDVEICELNMACPLEPYPSEVIENGGEIFSGDRVISAVVSSPNASPKKVKIFIWRKI